MTNHHLSAAGGLSQLQDRVETVHFPNRGLFLVICGVLPHFFDAATNRFEMFGYVRVLPDFWW